MSAAHQPLDAESLNALGVLNLAHVGDAVYELLVRDSLARDGPLAVRDQHRRTIGMVSAPAQARALEELQPILTEEEKKICRRGRNVRVHGVPGGCTIAQYHAATALETLFGWLWLRGEQMRLRELFDTVLKGIDNAP